jgi:xanthine dehydrogenase accessory factor
MVGPRATAALWLARGEPAVVVRVARAQGSVPRETGTRMLVSATAFDGSIGGGHLEWRAIELARRLLAGAGTLPHEEHVPLGPALGQCCGGAVTLAYEALDAAALAAWPQRPALFHLQLYGAGHVGRAIVRALAPLPLRVDWIDEREDEFPPDAGLPPQVHKVCVDAVQAEVALAPPGSMYLVLTHQHDLDLRITEAITRRGDFGYLGLIGSATKRARFFKRLAERGIAPEVIERITCPIGVPGIVGKEPEVIAAAVVAQLLQVASARQP